MIDLSDHDSEKAKIRKEKHKYKCKLVDKSATILDRVNVLANLLDLIKSLKRNIEQRTASLFLDASRPRDIGLCLPRGIGSVAFALHVELAVPYVVGRAGGDLPGRPEAANTFV